MIMQRGGAFVPGPMVIQRSVEVEMEGGQRLTGRIDRVTWSLTATSEYIITLKRSRRSGSETGERGRGGCRLGECWGWRRSIPRPRAQGRGAMVRNVRGMGGGVGAD